VATVEGLANVAHAARPPPRLRFNRRQRTVEHLLIGIDQVSDLHILEAEQIVDVRLAAAVETGHRNSHPVVGADHPARSFGAGDGERGAGGE
jgi:hypothetical protein